MRPAGGVGWGGVGCSVCVCVCVWRGALGQAAELQHMLSLTAQHICAAAIRNMPASRWLHTNIQQIRKMTPTTTKGTSCRSQPPCTTLSQQPPPPKPHPHHFSSQAVAHNTHHKFSFPVPSASSLRMPQYSNWLKRTHRAMRAGPWAHAHEPLELSPIRMHRPAIRHRQTRAKALAHPHTDARTHRLLTQAHTHPPTYAQPCRCTHAHTHAHTQTHAPLKHIRCRPPSHDLRLRRCRQTRACRSLLGWLSAPPHSCRMLR
jgi:hypothetical protein